ncbi:hypothetical protein AVEN_37600-1 [Araneus ventricosus]|uniref:Reverse transcriptase domain-containing protein n=1 Tax=Araneus ventricosus TaxID=182803 RepID=A0A4Y2I762_ARAVE|nr:hypothetical protein AVEN_37600-1 [Araneus ventricosus]
MVPKKGTLDWRPVGDYRALNSQTLKDKYPIPCIADFTAELHGSKIFSRIDLIKAYNQIPIHPEDTHKTAICTPFGKELLAADALSRNPQKVPYKREELEAEIDAFIQMITSSLPASSRRLDEIRAAQLKHETFQKLTDYVLKRMAIKERS